MLKKPLKDLNKQDFWNISKRVNDARRQLNEMQGNLNSNPIDPPLKNEEREKINKLFTLSKTKESPAKQISKVH